MQAEDMATASPPTLYTIGHSNVPAEKIVDLLRQFQIALLVDVRSQPYSKYSSQFNREIFAQTLREAVIDYRYMGDILGDLNTRRAQVQGMEQSRGNGIVTADTASNSSTTGQAGVSAASAGSSRIPM